MTKILTSIARRFGHASGWAFLWLALVCGIASGQQDGQGVGAGEGALFLLLPIGAQGVGLGRAMTAISGDEAAFWNPSGLAGVEERRVTVYRGDHLAGDATAVNVLIPWDRVGTVGVAYLLLDLGSQDLRDDFGDVLGSISVRNHVGIASFATSLPARMTAGVNMKLVQFRVACRGQCPDLQTTSSAYALDVGVQAEPLLGIPLRIGAMVAHAGTVFQILNEEQSDPLPTRMRVAVAYEALHRFADEVLMELWITVEAEDRIRDIGNPSLYLGMDFAVADFFFLRAGYVGGELDQTGGASVGVGLRVDRFDLNLAKSLARSSLTGGGQPIHVTFGVGF